KRGDRAERFVVQALLAETFLEVFLEFVQGHQFAGQRGLLGTLRRAEEFLVSGIHQRSDFAAHQNSGARLMVNRAVLFLEIDGVVPMTDTNDSATSRRDRETGLSKVFQPVLKRRILEALSAKEHTVTPGAVSSRALLRPTPPRRCCHRGRSRPRAGIRICRA